jgi:hypothetical protein
MLNGFGHLQLFLICVFIFLAGRVNSTYLDSDLQCVICHNITKPCRFFLNQEHAWRNRINEIMQCKMKTNRIEQRVKKSSKIQPGWLSNALQYTYNRTMRFV